MPDSLHREYILPEHNLHANQKSAPLSVAASWPTPNYINPPTRGPALEYICIIFSALAVAIVSARISSRLFITRALGWDDFLIVVGLGLSIAMCVLVVIANKVYFDGRHIWDVPPSTFVPHRHNVWISEWLFILAGTSIKISVLLFYRRLSVKFNKGFLIATWVGIVYNVLYVFAFTLTLLLICSPVEAYWNRFDPMWVATHKFHCARQGIAIPAAVGLSVFGDFYSTLLPLLLIFTLRLPLKQKLALYSLFALGFLACAFGVVRVYLINKLLNQTYDFTWWLWEMWIWSVVELYVAMFAASAPALKPFLRRFVVDSIGSLARYSRRRGETDRVSYAGQKGTPVSSSLNGEPEMDVVNIGVAYAGDQTEIRERGFWKDLGHQGTRRFTLRSEDGKIIPMQVYEQEKAPAVESARQIYVPDWDYSNAVSPTNWPMPPTTVPAGRKRPFVPSQASQQTIYVGLQVEPDTYTPVPAAGSVKAPRLRAENQMAQTQERDFANYPRSSEGIQDGVKAPSRLAPGKDSDKAMRHGENPAMRTINLSPNRAATVKSKNGAIHPTMRSRDFDSERREYAHGRRDGFMI